MATVSDTEAGLTLAEDLTGIISEFRRAVRRQAGALAEVALLTGAQVQLVRVVRRHPGISVADAAGELGLAPNTVSTLVRQLVDAGVLERRPGVDDRRVANLFLRPSVAKSFGDWIGKRSDVVAEALVSLNEEDRRALEGALAPLARLSAAIGALKP